MLLNIARANRVLTKMTQGHWAWTIPEIFQLQRRPHERGDTQNFRPKSIHDQQRVCCEQKTNKQHDTTRKLQSKEHCIETGHPGRDVWFLPSGRLRQEDCWYRRDEESGDWLRRGNGPPRKLNHRSRFDYWYTLAMYAACWHYSSLAIPRGWLVFVPFLCPTCLTSLRLPGRYDDYWL